MEDACAHSVHVAYLAYLIFKAITHAAEHEE
jgi:hypothetical protein